MVNSDKLYGIYGGLHIAPFGNLDEKCIEIIESLKQYRFQKIVANHCTGIHAINKMREFNYPLIELAEMIENKSNS